MGEWGFISMMIEMVLAGASKKDLTIVAAPGYYRQLLEDVQFWK